MNRLLGILVAVIGLLVALKVITDLVLAVGVGFILVGLALAL